MVENVWQKEISQLCSRYADICEYRLLARSAALRSIPIIRIGSGSRAALYIGGQDGRESVSSGVLMNFARELCGKSEKGELVVGVQAKYLTSTRTFFIIPCLNPDGNAAHTLENAHGVDISHNYNCDFELGGDGGYPESESESAAVCRFIRSCPIETVLELTSSSSSSAQGSFLCAPCADADDLLGKRRSKLCALASRLCPYREEEEDEEKEEEENEKADLSGTLIGWMSAERNNNPCAMRINCAGSVNQSYAQIKKLLFRIPLCR